MNSDSPSPTERPTLDDLAAFALDAVDADEARAIGTHLATDAAAAATERSLRSAAGELAGAGVVNVDVTPPPSLRNRVLGAALARRPAADRSDATPAEMHRTELSRALALFRGLDAAVWDRPVDPPELAGWTVQDLVVHLVANETLLAQAIGLTSPPVPETETTNEERTARAQARHRDRPPADALVELEQAAAAVDAHVSGLSDEQLLRTVEYWGRPTSIRGILFTRSFETWTHADDVRRAAGLPEQPPPPPSMHALCRAAVNLVPLMLQTRGVDVPHALVRFHLDGPGAQTLDLPLPAGGARPPGVDPPAAELFVDTVALCRAVSGRVPAGGLPHTGRGDLDLTGRIVEAVPALAVI